MDKAIQKELDIARKRAADAEAEDAHRTAESAKATAAARAEFEASDQGQVARENADAYRIMSLPSPEALEELQKRDAKAASEPDVLHFGGPAE